ncbi:MAG: threonine-phosphate decarboxylase CobD [Lachnospiraceae bacterium]|nr:threonine-phosphate decarboxylase CobD [Lachnospiraceae bacterium]
MELLHGGNIYDENLNMEGDIPLLDFSANINPLGMPESVRSAVCDALDLAHNYPDPLCRKLRAALSEEYELPAEFFLCGNGGADLIYRLAYALRPKRALLTAPTFAEYEEALKQTGTELRFYEMQRDFVVREDILAQMDDSIDVMFLCNPNNPTGLLVDEDLLLRILEKARQRGILFVLDECFLDFTGQPERSLVPYAGQSPHLLILKSFTKMYAMPGLRLGYCICSDKELLARMAVAGQCWGVSVPASEAGIAALKEKEYTQCAIRLVRKERIFLKSELEKLGFEVWDGQADYLFFRAPGVHDLYERLLPQRILIRRCTNYRGLDDTYYRAAVKNHKENERLMQAIASVV